MNTKRLEEIIAKYKETSASGFCWSTELQQAVWKHVGELLNALAEAWKRAEKAETDNEKLYKIVRKWHRRTAEARWWARRLLATNKEFSKFHNELSAHCRAANSRAEKTEAERDEARAFAQKQYERAEKAEAVDCFTAMARAWSITEEAEDYSAMQESRRYEAEKAAAAWKQSAKNNRISYQAQKRLIDELEMDLRQAYYSLVEHHRDYHHGSD